MSSITLPCRCDMPGCNRNIVQHVAGVDHRNEIPVDRYEAVEAALVEAGEHEAELRSLAGIPAAWEGA